MLCSHIVQLTIVVTQVTFSAGSVFALNCHYHTEPDAALCLCLITTELRNVMRALLVSISHRVAEEASHEQLQFERVDSSAVMH